MLSEIFPSRADLDGMLEALPSAPLHASLAVIDPLVPPPSQYRTSKTVPLEHDVQGFSKYARIVHGLLLHLADDRQAARENVWALHHFFSLSIYAEDLKHLPFAESPVFSRKISRLTLQSLIDKVQQLSTYLLSPTAEEQWHSSVTTALVSQGPVSGLDGVGQLVVDLVARAKRHDTVRDSRVLHMILRHALSTASKDDAEQWMLVSRKIEKQGEPLRFIVDGASPEQSDSSSYVPGHRILGHALRTGAHASRPLPKRARSWHPRSSRLESQHGRTVAPPQPGRFCTGSRVGYCLPPSAPRGEPYQGVPAMDHIRRGLGG